jgi:hypothetical protein
MPFNWDEYLTLAEQLAQNNDEASKRASVSRAYYSAFNEAMARAEKNCGPKQGGNSHDWCWNRYIFTVDPTGNCYDLANKGNRLKGMRVRADYDASDIPRIDDFVQKALRSARDLKGRLNALDGKFPAP